MTDLLILGNGFDRHHGLDTDYKGTYQKVLYDIDPLLFDIVNRVFFDETEELWNDFENHVGRLTHDFLEEFEARVSEEIDRFNSENSDPNVYAFDPEDDRYGDRYSEIDNAIHGVHANKPSAESLLGTDIRLNKLRSYLTEGLIKLTENANKTLEGKDKFTFCSDVRVITFNYTETVEKLYGVAPESILHLHGTAHPVWGNKIDQVTKGEEISFDTENYYFDHNYSVELADDGKYYPYPSNISDFESALSVDEEVSKLREWVDSNFEEYGKQLEEEDLKKFLESIGESKIDRVFVMGHSLGEVDIPYFQIVAEKFPDASWTISYHLEETEEKERREEKEKIVKRNEKIFDEISHSKIKIDSMTVEEILNMITSKA